jgi:hypothetical protein
MRLEENQLRFIRMCNMNSMLPDFPTLKQELEEVLFLQLCNAIKDRNVLARHSSSIVQHEGNQMSHDQLTALGKRVVTGEYERAEAEVMIPIEEVPEMVDDKLFQKLNELADSIAGQTSRSGYKKLDDVISEAGGSVDARGEGLTAEHYLQALEGMEINFDPDTLQPTFIIIIHPAMTPAMEKLKEVIENDGEIKKRYDDLMARKLKDWRDRENNRRLVD